MGQKVHPYGFRLGFNRTWHSRWFSEKDYAKLLHEDLKLRKELKRRLSHAGVSEIDIERAADKLKVNIQTSRPGHHHRQAGAEVDKLRDELRKRTGTEVHINIMEIQRPETGRAARGRVDRAAARAARGVPPRDEEGRSSRRSASAPRAIKIRSPAGSTAPRSRAPSGTRRAACRSTRSRPTSTTASPRRTRRTARSA